MHTQLSEIMQRSFVHFAQFFLMTFAKQWCKITTSYRLGCNSVLLRFPSLTCIQLWVHLFVLSSINVTTCVDLCLYYHSQITEQF